MQAFHGEVSGDVECASGTTLALRVLMVAYGAVFELGPGETCPDHPCTAVALYESDHDLLGYMLQDLRSLLRGAWAGTMVITPHEPIVWSVHGYVRRTVICDPDALARPGALCIVGFFGERRHSHAPQMLEEAERELLQEFHSYPGISSYSSMELADGYWANLVVHREPDDREAWRSSAAHVRAVSVVAPESYLSVRIHNGRLPGGVIGSDSIVLDATKYWDYQTEPVWRGLRRLVPRS